MPYSDYRPDLMGSATLDAVGQLRGGLAAELHAGLHGRRVRRRRHRLDQDRLPLRHRLRPGAVHRSRRRQGYTTVEASNGATLEAKWEFKRNIRPWSRSLYIGVVKDFLAPGDTITIRFGDRRHRLARHPPADLLRERVRVPRASPTRSPPTTTWRCPRARRSRSCRGRACAGARCCRRWCARASRSGWRSRPTTSGAIRPISSIATLRLEADGADRRAARRRCASRRAASRAVVEGLRVAEPGDLHRSACSTRTARSCAGPIPLRVVAEDDRARAFLGRHARPVERDARHQHGARIFRVRPRQGLPRRDGPPGQRLPDHRRVLARAQRADARSSTSPAASCASPATSGRPTRRSAATATCTTATRARPSTAPRTPRSPMRPTSATRRPTRTTRTSCSRSSQGKDCVVVAHVGGRYADIKYAHDAAWRPRSRCTRPGARSSGSCATPSRRTTASASSPTRTATRAGRAPAIPAPRSSAATAGSPASWPSGSIATPSSSACAAGATTPPPATARLLDVTARAGARRRGVRARSGGRAGASRRRSRRLIMGDIARVADDEVELAIEVVGSAPIERLDIYDGLDLIETVRPYAAGDLGSRVRLVYEGAEYRGRARTTTWDGSLTIEGNRIVRTGVINNWNLDRGIQKQDAIERDLEGRDDRQLRRHRPVAGDGAAGRLAFKTAPVSGEVAIAELGVEPRVFAAGGLERAVKLQRLPEVMTRAAHGAAAQDQAARRPATRASTSACSRRTATACGRARSICSADPSASAVRLQRSPQSRGRTRRAHPCAPVRWPQPLRVPREFAPIRSRAALRRCCRAAGRSSPSPRLRAGWLTTGRGAIRRSPRRCCAISARPQGHQCPHDRRAQGRDGGDTQCQVPWDHSALTEDFQFRPVGELATGSIPSAAKDARLEERTRRLDEELGRRPPGGP